MINLEQCTESIRSHERLLKNTENTLDAFLDQNGLPAILSGDKSEAVQDHLLSEYPRLYGVIIFKLHLYIENKTFTTTIQFWINNLYIHLNFDMAFR